MPYVAPLILSADERSTLQHLVKHARLWRERQRAQTILWLADGKTVVQIAELHGVIPETIRLHRRKWNKFALDFIWEGHRSGAPSTLNDEHRQQIKQWVEQEPLSAEQLRLRLFEKTAISVSVNIMQRELRKLGMVYKRTRHDLKKKIADTI